MSALMDAGEVGSGLVAGGCPASPVDVITLLLPLVEHVGRGTYEESAA